jgi:hypothetical protein
MAKDYAERARWVLREAEEAPEATNYAIEYPRKPTRPAICIQRNGWRCDLNCG